MLARLFSDVARSGRWAAGLAAANRRQMRTATSAGANAPSRNACLGEAEGAFVEEQVAEKGYGTSSEYVRELIRRDQDRQHLRNLLLDGAQSPPARPADAAYFDALRDHIRRHID
jgi:antitoxin ParD1/3/4